MSNDDIGCGDSYHPKIHPALLDEATLTRECQMEQTRRGGPGGQHRNKTSTAIVWTHSPSGVRGEGSERRSQIENRQVAWRRLRENLAIEVRSAGANIELKSPADKTSSLAEPERFIREKYSHRDLRVSINNDDFPALLALVLDDFVNREGKLSAVATEWGTSTSQVVRFLKSLPAALVRANRYRQSFGQRPIK